MAGGVASRPYVTSLSVINNGVSTPVITNGTTTPPPLVNGAVTTVVAPFNLCAAGQTPASGVCYSTPNRVGLTVGYGNDANVGMDFSNPNFPVVPVINANSVIDMTVAMNTLGKSLGWTWVNGDLLYWQTTDLGQADATVHIKFKPASFPWVTFPQGPGPTCTASPPQNCDIQKADAELLTANLVFSLDNTLNSPDSAMAGTVFATQDAVMGYLTPGGSALAPSLDIEMASSHTKSDGSPQLGPLEALVPAATLLNLYGILPADATSAFTTTRGGDSGTNGTPTYTPWTAAVNGSDGLLVNVNDITFSVPKYHLRSKLKHLTTYGNARGGKTTIRARGARCSKKNKCVVSLYNLGRGKKLFVAHKALVLKNYLQTRPRMSLVVSSARVHRGSRYLLVVHSAAKHRKLRASGLGKVFR